MTEFIPGKKLSSVDVKPGQMVRANTIDGLRYFKVEAVYPFIVTCRNIDNGLLDSFPKADFIIGAVRICQ